MSRNTPPQNCLEEHEVLTYLRVQESMNNVMRKNPAVMEIKINNPLTNALDAMSCIPFVQYNWDGDTSESLFIDGLDAGTLKKTNVDIILQNCTQSSFGRGTETILDPLYRSGREISAANIQYENSYPVSRVVGKYMFPGREVSLKLYKLAVYETGGHFDWHMDSTHSDIHHGTLLVALNTSWEGGDLVLRRNGGTETPVDLRPLNSDGNTSLQAVAFFTDTEHCVHPVKSGLRIVLQYDIEVEKKMDQDKENTESSEGEDTDKLEDTEQKKTQEKDADTGDSDEDDYMQNNDPDEDMDDEDIYEPWMRGIEEHYKGRGGDSQATADKAALRKVLKIIKKWHKEGTKEVAFALQHLYRRASISADYLKGADAVLYNALLASGNFDVSLHPVILCEESDWDGEMESRHAYRYENPQAGAKPKKPSAFHVPKLSAIREISSREYVEHTGNEAQASEYRYFSGGMFVSPKAN